MDCVSYNCLKSPLRCLVCSLRSRVRLLVGYKTTRHHSFNRYIYQSVIEATRLPDLALYLAFLQFCLTTTLTTIVGKRMVVIERERRTNCHLAIWYDSIDIVHEYTYKARSVYKLAVYATVASARGVNVFFNFKMKNVDEVAVIDLGRPSSTQSQIGLDEPDAPYIKCGSALMPGAKQLLY